MSGTFEKIYAIVRNIPVGTVATYGQIAHMAGMPRGGRIVGYAVASCPEGAGVPGRRAVSQRWPGGHGRLPMAATKKRRMRRRFLKLIFCFYDP